MCIDNYKKVDEIPFDFSRKMMSVIVDTPEHEYQILTKGAPEAVFARCTQFESEGEILPMEPILIGDLIQEYNDLSSDGFLCHSRLLARVSWTSAPPIQKPTNPNLFSRATSPFSIPPRNPPARPSPPSRTTASPSRC